jgi:hypothetical protein
MDDNEKAKLVIKIIIDSDTKVLESEFIAKAADLSIQEVNRIINILAENGVIKTIKALDSISNGKIGILKTLETELAISSNMYQLNKEPKFNIYIKTDFNTYNLFEVSSDNLNTIINAYLMGSDSFTISGDKYWLLNLQKIKIFKAEIDINNGDLRFKGTKSGLLEHDITKRNLMSIEFLKLFGEDITPEVLGDSEFGSKQKKNEVNNESDFVSKSRIEELREINSPDFDLSRLIRLCEELNDNYIRENYLSVIMIIRTIINHVPPIFNVSNFDMVVSNIAGKDKSFKKNMENLNLSLKNIADKNLHQQIRKSETLPNSSQVKFSPDLDVLLEEVVRILK